MNSRLIANTIKAQFSIYVRCDDTMVGAVTVENLEWQWEIGINSICMNSSWQGSVVHQLSSQIIIDLMIFFLITQKAHNNA